MDWIFFGYCNVVVIWLDLGLVVFVEYRKFVFERNVEVLYSGEFVAIGIEVFGVFVVVIVDVLEEDEEFGFENFVVVFEGDFEVEVVVEEEEEEDVFFVFVFVVEGFVFVFVVVDVEKGWGWFGFVDVIVDVEDVWVVFVFGVVDVVGVGVYLVVEFGVFVRRVDFEVVVVVVEGVGVVVVWMIEVVGIVVEGVGLVEF